MFIQLFNSSVDLIKKAKKIKDLTQMNLFDTPVQADIFEGQTKEFGTGDTRKFDGQKHRWVDADKEQKNTEPIHSLTTFNHIGTIPKGHKVTKVTKHTDDSNPFAHKNPEAKHILEIEDSTGKKTHHVYDNEKHRDEDHDHIVKKYDIKSKAKTEEPKKEEQPEPKEVGIPDQKENEKLDNSAEPVSELEAMKKKLEAAKLLQHKMVEGNKIVRQKGLTDNEKIEKLSELLNTPKEKVKSLLEPDFAGRLGFPSYRLTNNNANISRMEQRVKELASREEDKERAHKENDGSAVENVMSYDGAQVVNNYEAERVQILFDKIPSAEIRTDLKRSGWRWSPSNSAWQRKNTSSGIYSAKTILDKHFKQKEMKQEEKPNNASAKSEDFASKIQEFADRVKADVEHYYSSNGYTSSAHEPQKQVHVRPGAKYVKVDVGSSGKFMIDSDTGEIFGIKGYGVPNKKKVYGTIHNTEGYYWGSYSPIPKTVKAKAKSEIDKLMDQGEDL